MIRSSKIGPAAQLLLDGSGLAATDITPTGPGGIITKGDVLAAVSSGVKPQQVAQPAAQAPQDVAKPDAQAPPQAAVQPPPEQQKAQQVPKAEVKKEVASEGGVQSGKVTDQKPSAVSVSLAAVQQPFETAVQQKRGGSDWKLRAILAEKMLHQGQRIPDSWLRDWVGAKKQ